MLYKKNLPRWERITRFITGALMASCAVHYGLTPVGLGFGVATLMALATAFVGFCPICALAGRRLRNTSAASSS
jgi:hypothetical protein